MTGNFQVIKKKKFKCSFMGVELAGKYSGNVEDFCKFGAYLKLKFLRIRLPKYA